MAIEENVLLSICIPTYNRCKALNRTLHTIVECKLFQETSLCQIVISDNSSTDNTQKVCESFVKRFPDKIKYIRQENPIPPDVNIFKSLTYADGVYTKLHNDTLNLKPNALEYMLSNLENSKDAGIVFFTNGNKTNFEDFSYCKNADDFLAKVGFYTTWIGGFCVKNGAIETLENPYRFKYLKLQQVDILLNLINKGNKVVVSKENIFNTATTSIQGSSYNVAKVFGRNFLKILKVYLQDKSISSKTYKIVKKDLLIHQINPRYFNFGNKIRFVKSGYFRYLKDYRYDLYFYFEYCKLPLKFVSANIQKFFDLIKDKNFNRKWRKLNRHNSVYLVNRIDNERVLVGVNTKGFVDVEFFGKNSFEILYIGNNCTIEKGAKFVFKTNDDIIVPDNTTIKSDAIITNDMEYTNV